MPRASTKATCWSRSAGRPSPSIDALHKRLMQLPVGQPAEVVFLRAGRRITRSVVPGEYPDRD